MLTVCFYGGRLILRMILDVQKVQFATLYGFFRKMALQNFGNQGKDYFGCNCFSIPLVTVPVMFEANSLAPSEALSTSGLLRTLFTPLDTPEKNTCTPSPIIASTTAPTIIQVSTPIGNHLTPLFFFTIIIAA